jgi:hypothetical protein
MSGMKISLLAVAILATACANALAAEASSEGSGFPQPYNFNYIHAPGADEDARAATAPAGTSAYQFVAGSAFTSRTSTQSVTYPGSGCKFSDGALTTDVQLPSGATVNGVRLYYYNNAAPGSVGLFFTNYDGAGNFNDLLADSSTMSTGYSSEYFPLPTPHVINNANTAYVLTATMSANLRFCGARVFYATP